MDRPVRDLVCPACGKQFQTKGRTQLYCSFKCARTKGNGIKAKTKEVTCPTCKKMFEIPLHDHRIKEGQTTFFCSKKCEGIYKRKGRFNNCPICGKTFYTTRAKTCSPECGRIWKSKHISHKTYFENGYITEYKNGYNKKGNVKQHRRIMEEYLGRQLEPWEVVHHINGDKTDNRIENLKLMTRGEHSSLHRREEKASGKHLFGGYHNN